VRATLSAVDGAWRRDNRFTAGFEHDFVCAAIEIDDRRSSRKHGRRTVYAFCISPDTPSDGGKECILRSYMEWSSMLPITKVRPKPLNYDRLSDIDQRRQELDRSFKEIFLNAGYQNPGLRDKLNAFLSSGTHTGAFLTPTFHGVGSPKLLAGIRDILMTSLVCVQVSNTLWSEECMVLTRDQLIFLKHSSKSSGSKSAIDLRSIIGVRRIDGIQGQLVIGGTGSLLISTFSRQYLVMVRGQQVCDDWDSFIQLTVAERMRSIGFSWENGELKNTVKIDAPLTSSSSLSFSSEGLKTDLKLLARPKSWNLGDRVILNARTYTRNSPRGLFSAHSSLVTLIRNPNRLVETLLQKAFRLCASPNSGDGGKGTNMTMTSLADGESENYVAVDLSEDEMPIDVQCAWIEFLDGVSLLQAIDLKYSGLGSEELLCLMLNVYHCLLIHAFLVVGVPNGASKWRSFYCSSSYEAFGDVFSLIELEHCIIRRNMSKPSSAIAQMLIPTSRYAFALNAKDYRLLWAINSGSVSSYPSIPVFRPTTLDSQLDLLVR
jgi:Protein of unknown function, DUF547